MTDYRLNPYFFHREDAKRRGSSLRYPVQVKASLFEFQYRFIFIAVLFWGGFLLYFVDRYSLAWLLAHALVWDGLPQATNVTIVLWIGFGFALLAAMLRFWAAAYLTAEVVGDPKLRTEALVADGPYRFVRNPLYVGLVLLGTGIGFMASRTGGIIMIVGLIFFSLRLARRESAELAAAHPGYAAYRDAVPELIPALTPRLPASGCKPRWGQALFGEMGIYGFALAVGAFAYTRSFPVFGMVVLVAYAIYFFSRVVLAMQRAQRRKELA